jgi:hypothetical protein
VAAALGVAPQHNFITVFALETARERETEHANVNILLWLARSSRHWWHAAVESIQRLKIPFAIISREPAQTQTTQ